MFTTLTTKNAEYKLRLTTKATVGLEKALGYNPVELLLDIDNGKMPKLNDLLIILHACLQAYNHGLSMDKVYDIYDDFIEDGDKNMFDLIPIFIEVFQDCGYLSKNPEEDSEDAKN